MKDSLAAQEVALLIDGENLSSKHVGKLIVAAGRLGPLRIKRIYGNASRVPGWDTAPGFRMMHSGCGKNSADMLLVIEAMDLLWSAGIKTFVIATSDGDFSHLAHYIRECGAQIIGIGEAKAPDVFRKACTRFLELPCPKSIEAAPPKSTPVEPKVKVSPVDQKIQAYIKGNGANTGVKIQDLGVHMNRRHLIKISTLPEKTWRKYLTDRPDLFACDPRGQEARVRLV